MCKDRCSLSCPQGHLRVCLADPLHTVHSALARVLGGEGPAHAPEGAEEAGGHLESGCTPHRNRDDRTHGSGGLLVGGAACRMVITRTLHGARPGEELLPGRLAEPEGSQAEPPCGTAPAVRDTSPWRGSQMHAGVHSPAEAVKAACPRAAGGHLSPRAMRQLQ